MFLLKRGAFVQEAQLKNSLYRRSIYDLYIRLFIFIQRNTLLLS